MPYANADCATSLNVAVVYPPRPTAAEIENDGLAVFTAVRAGGGLGGGGLGGGGLGGGGLGGGGGGGGLGGSGGGDGGGGGGGGLGMTVQTVWRVSPFVHWFVGHGVHWTAELPLLYVFTGQSA